MVWRLRIYLPGSSKHPAEEINFTLLRSPLDASQDLGARGDYNSTIGSYYSEALDADYSCTIYAYLYDLENAFLGSGYDCITWNTADMTDIENVTTTRSTTSGNIHDLSGRKLSTVTAAKGIYIRNGKKYVR